MALCFFFMATQLMFARVRSRNEIVKRFYRQRRGQYYKTHSIFPSTSQTAFPCQGRGGSSSGSTSDNGSRDRGFNSRRQELGFFSSLSFQKCVLNQVPHGGTDFSCIKSAQLRSLSKKIPCSPMNGAARIFLLLPYALAGIRTRVSQSFHLFERPFKGCSNN